MVFIPNYFILLYQLKLKYSHSKPSFMASTSETGIDVNVANFRKLTLTATAFGTAYNPSNSTITLQALNVLCTNADHAVDEANKAIAAHIKVANDREVAFGALNQRATQLINALEVAGATPQTMDNAKTILRKLRGQRSTPKLTEAEKAALLAEGKEVTQISASQLGYDNRIANFGKLLDLIETEPQYAPNEDELKLLNARAYYTALKTANDAVAAAEVRVNNARKQRNAIFSTPITGMLAVADTTKKYVKSVFNSSSNEYKQVVDLKFTTLKK